MNMTMTPISVGMTGEKSWAVEQRYCTRRGDYNIFSTPNMVQLAEFAAMEALAPCLGPGQVTVGTRVDVQHLAPTLEGMNVRAVATLKEADGARLSFEVELFDELGKVGQVAHERYVLEFDRYVRRLEKKKAELAAFKAKGGSGD